MSYIEPNLGQTQQNKKILQELEEKKRRMRSNTSSPIQSDPILQSLSTSTNNNLISSDNPIQPIQKQLQQQPFATFYNTNTFGYFINTDSAFGNQILPVLPRF